MRGQFLTPERRQSPSQRSSSRGGVRRGSPARQFATSREDISFSDDDDDDANTHDNPNNSGGRGNGNAYGHGAENGEKEEAADDEEELGGQDDNDDDEDDKDEEDVDYYSILNVPSTVGNPKLCVPQMWVGHGSKANSKNGPCRPLQAKYARPTTLTHGGFTQTNSRQGCEIEQLNISTECW